MVSRNVPISKVKIGPVRVPPLLVIEFFNFTLFSTLHYFRHLGGIFYVKIYLSTDIHKLNSKIGYLACSSINCSLSKWDKVNQNVSKRFDSFPNFHSALATFEPQNYVVARPVWGCNILVVSGRLVDMFD